MPDYMSVEPDELRRIAAQHDLAAATLRAWGEIPQAWLDEYKHTYGAIAEPMRAALVDYYDRRHDRAERLAANHERTRDELLAAAKALEHGDQSGAHNVARSGGNAHSAGNGHGASPSGPAHGAPTDPVSSVHTGSDTPTVTSTEPGQPSAITPGTPGMPDGIARSDQTPLSPVGSSPQTYDALPVATAGDSNSAVGTAGDSGGAVGTAGDSGGAVGTAGDSSLVGGMPAPLVTGPYPASADPGGVGTTARRPGPLPVGPFAAAVHTADDRRALPSLVVGERGEDDLALARTLLAAVLAAVRDSALGVEWAVAVGRSYGEPIVMLTSTEGRGWLPPGLFLPLEVVLPWRWDSLLRTPGRDAFAALEGITDPARMLAEFGVIVGRRRSARISALVSSTAISDVVRAAVGDDSAFEEWVGAAESAVDFTAPGAGLVDRLALAGSDELLRQAATVPDTEIRAKCVELARAADARVRTAVSGIDGETATRRARRQRILDALHAGQPIPASWWDEFRAADDMTAEALRWRRVDVSHVPVGGVRSDVSGTEALRGMVFERRADELLLLLAAGEPDRQTLRDVLYTYGQISEHPLLPAAALVVATERTGAGTAIPDVEVVRGVEPSANGVSSVSVGSARVNGAPPPIAQLLRGPAGSGGSSEHRRG